MFFACIRAKHLLVAITLTLLICAGCASSQQNKLATGPVPGTQQLLTALQAHFRTATSFHVNMQVQNPGPIQDGQIQIRSANGDVVMPDKVKALATVTLSGQSVQVNLISVGDKQFITDPITGQWRAVKGVLDPRTLTNPDTGIVSLVGKVQNISQPIADSANGTPCWRVTGQLDAKYIAFFTGGGVPAGTMLQTSACIGQADSLPYQLIVTGQAAAGDTMQTSRTFNISSYNENIAISAPQA